MARTKQAGHQLTDKCADKIMNSLDEDCVTENTDHDKVGATMNVWVYYLTCGGLVVFRLHERRGFDRLQLLQVPLGMQRLYPLTRC